MKRLPSIGFIYIVVVVLSFLLFLLWAVRPGWYERVHSGKEKSQHVRKWAAYLEKIADDFPQKSRQAGFLEEAADLRTKLKQPDKALADLNKALELSDGDEKLTGRVLRMYSATGKKDEAMKLAKELVLKGNREWDVISVLLDDLSKYPGQELRSQLTEALMDANVPGKLLMDGGRITGVGFTGDRWTIDGKPAYLIAQGLPDRPLIQELWLTCYADSTALPLTATIEDGTNRVVHIFQQQGRVKIKLPEIPAGENGLFAIKTDKYAPPAGGSDSRKLGVRVTTETERRNEALSWAKKRLAQGNKDWPTLSVLLDEFSKQPTTELQSQIAGLLMDADIPGKLLMDGDGITGIGFASDYWTTDGKPGYLMVQGLPDRPLIQDLWLTCYADSTVLPLIATIEDGKNRVAHTFQRQGRVKIKLPEIPAGENRIFVVRTDKIWVPKGGKDMRKLGVRVMVAD